MALEAYRESSTEQERSADLLRLTPSTGRASLDIGCRDGHFSRLLAQRFDQVIALDLSLPTIEHPRVACVQGDAAALAFADGAFDFVFCAEVLEHVPPDMLEKVGLEIERVANRCILVGVPYKQDIRLHRTTCRSCGGKNPPWGHVNSFDEARLARLFPRSVVQQLSFVGTTTSQTNGLSAWLMDLAGNPYGTYSQDEPCVHCGNRLTSPGERSLTEKVFTKLGFWSCAATSWLARPRGNWMHMLLSREE